MGEEIIFSSSAGLVKSDFQLFGQTCNLSCSSSGLYLDSKKWEVSFLTGTKSMKMELKIGLVKVENETDTLLYDSFSISSDNTDTTQPNLGGSSMNIITSYRNNNPDLIDDTG